MIYVNGKMFVSLLKTLFFLISELYLQLGFALCFTGTYFVEWNKEQLLAQIAIFSKHLYSELLYWLCVSSSVVHVKLIPFWSMILLASELSWR